MKKLSTKEIREMWKEFFISKKHLLLESSSLVPIEDESIFWINSGVATLKSYFTGKEKPPSKRIVKIQKSLRTNDIENVGRTARHHTFFEMLGNFSIGDYFKEESIQMAIELLNSKKYLDIPMSKLFFTVYKEDVEALKILEKNKIPKNKIFKMGRKTNFWDLGSGPCGPSLEIFFDKGEKFNNKNAEILIKEDIENDRFIEIWNIVFSEFNNNGQNVYTPLPQKNIDTGAGLERISSCLQETPTNFEIDDFSLIIKEISNFSNKKYTWDYVLNDLRKKDPESFEINSKFKAIADFSRSILFSISDGVLPSSNGRGYIIRKLIRKTILYSLNLDIKENFLIPVFKKILIIYKSEYKYLELNFDKVKEIVEKEEKSFYETIQKGKKIFSKFLKENKINSKNIFKLYETYGLPLELIKELCFQEKIEYKEEEIENLLKEFQLFSFENRKKIFGMEIQKSFFKSIEPTNFIGYEKLNSKSKVLHKDGDFVIFDKTPFYAESGGQISDYGFANTFKVFGVKKNSQNIFIHNIPNNDFFVNQIINLQVDSKNRELISRNHSAIHLFFSTLEKNLSTKLIQDGSKVTENYFRFDFLAQKDLDQEIIRKTESKVNDLIEIGFKTKINFMGFEESKKLNAKFLSNKNYNLIVRTVKLNEKILDLCGGTHVENINLIEKILITDFEKKGSGSFRIKGISGFKNISLYIQDKNIKYKNLKLEEINNYIYIIKNKFYSLGYDSKEEEKFFNLQKINIEKLNLKDEKFIWLLDLIFFEFKNYKKIIDKKIKKLIFSKIESQINESKIINVIKFKNISTKEYSPMALIKINEFKNKIIVAKLIDHKKLTIVVVVSKELVESNELNKVIKLIKENNLNGNGRNQLYIYGGKIELLKGLEEIRWE